MVHGLLVLQGGIPRGEEALTLVAVCIAVSIVAHSSSDMPLARLFHVDELAGVTEGGQSSSEGSRPRLRGSVRLRQG